MRVLIVDDDGDSVAVLAALLTTSGHDVRVEAGAYAGADTAASWRPDVALLDISLPDSGAYLIADRLRDTAGGHATRLVALTEWGQDEDRHRSTEAGFDHHLVKPVDPLHLRVLLTAVAARSREPSSTPSSG